MPADLYFIAPAEMDDAAIIAAARRVLARPGVAALLLRRGTRDAAEYGRLVAAIRPLAQATEAALMIEGEPADVRRLEADGLHLPAGLAAVRAAVKALKPDFIVGAGPAATRHEAMELGEAGPDYVLFGSLSGAISGEARELARWWAETMEIPSVLSDPEATPAAFDAEGCEFIGLTLAGAEVDR